MVYRFIKDNHHEFGVRWLLKKFNLSPNTYYNFLKNKKSYYYAKKQAICDEICQIYHYNNGIIGHRNMRIFLARKGIHLSKTTVHKYMNKELKLYSIVRKKKPGYVKGNSHKVFPNLIEQNFQTAGINKIWCTDFTYIKLTNGSKRYNCTIIDLHDRSVVASLNGKKITSTLAINTLKKAIKSQGILKRGLILHSDQGSQYTSKEFTDFCKSLNILQSMSRAGCPYDNAPMERYYNTFKCELIYLYNFHNDEELNKATNDFAYVWYNHIRPHSFNKGLTPFEARYKNIRSLCYKFA